MNENWMKLSFDFGFQLNEIIDTPDNLYQQSAIWLVRMNVYITFEKKCDGCNLNFSPFFMNCMFVKLSGIFETLYND